MNNQSKISFALSLCLIACLLLPGCLLPMRQQESTNHETADATRSDEQSKTIDDSQNSSSNLDGNAVSKLFEANQIPLEGNPVIGDYITSGGVHLTLTENGDYRWEEPTGFVLGKYTVSKGTLSADGYVYESETGSLYTVIVELQTTGAMLEGQIKPSVSLSMLVFDYYDSNVWRVTELMAGVQFEATRK